MSNLIIKELDEWREKICPNEYTQMLEFIYASKNKQKLLNKLLFLHGDIYKGTKLVIDIENSIGIDDCEYIQFSELFESNIYSSDYDDEEDNNDFAFEKKLYNILDKKCLIIENDILNYEDRFGLIKSFIGNDGFNVLDKQNDNMFTISKVDFNVIFIASRIPEKEDIKKRSIFVNL